jgi:hypothetical protein
MQTPARSKILSPVFADRLALPGNDSVGGAVARTVRTRQAGIGPLTISSERLAPVAEEDHEITKFVCCGHLPQFPEGDS